MRAPEQTFSYRYPHPAVTTDVVVFTIREQRLHLLLIQRANPPYQGQWALPGGFLDIDEDINACASRELAEETGLTDLFLEQLYTFGSPNRDPRERVISIAYYALVPNDRIAEPVASSDAAAVAWFPFDELPETAFDHAHIVAKAHERLVAKLDYSSIALQFMPEQFTLGELQAVYETLRGSELDKRNFRKHILSLDIIEETGEQKRNGKHRPARAYRARRPKRVEIIK